MSDAEWQMRLVSLHDKGTIEALLRRHPYLHLYSIGDLDDFFWEHTTWYGLGRDEPPVLLYNAPALPVLLALAIEPGADARELLRLVMPLLPRRFYAHLSGNLVDVLAEEYLVNSHGTHHKMGLTKAALLDGVETSEVRQLGASHVRELEALYRVSYPGNWFDARMLETGHYYGIEQSGALVSVAGVHVYSPAYRVAALGNITTHPDWRGRGLAAKVTAKLCGELMSTADHIGLNVKADHGAAIACYERLGFEKVASYEECLLEAKC